MNFCQSASANNTGTRRAATVGGDCSSITAFLATYNPPNISAAPVEPATWLTMEEIHVALLGTSLIVPSTPTQKQIMFLASLDLFWRNGRYNRRTIFYDISHEDYASAVDCLKRSLSQALVYFYPWAGRLIVGEDNRVALDCNDMGVEFIEAFIDLPYNELKKDNFRPKPCFNALCPRSNVPDGLEILNIPLLSIQVTRFLHGGMALGLAQSHVVADGHSLWHFMNSWAECGRGVPISMHPLHQREVLKLDNPLEEKAGVFLRLEKFENGSEGTDNEKKEELKPKVLVEQLFHFSSQMMKRLKKKTTEEGRGSFTSFEVLCAHFWKSVTKARKLDEKTPMQFTVLVNCRSRLSKPLPPAYFGNVISFGIASTTAEELLQESLASTAVRIHEAVKSCTERKLESLMHWLELHDNSFRDIFRIAKFSVGMMVASSPRFPVYEVDFGWGRPDAVRTSRVMGDGEMVLFAGKEGEGSVDICMPLTEASMERLEKDPEFLNF